MAAPTKEKLPVTVERPTPFTFDLGLLLVADANPLTIPKADPELTLSSIARDGAQSLINQILTVCPITSTPEGVVVTLPPVSTPLPREKPVPQAKDLTKWQRFAAKKGIKPKTREERKNLVFDEDSQTWRPRWGKGGMNKKGQDEWLVEVDMEKERERKEGTTARGDNRRERKDKMKRNERRMRKNLRDSEKNRR